MDAATARADRLREARARAIAKNKGQAVEKINGELCVEVPDRTQPQSTDERESQKVAAEARADEAMKALLAEEEISDQTQKGRKGKRGKGKGGNAEVERPRLSAKRQAKISRAMSYLLRHGATTAGLEMRPDGYVELTSLLVHKSLRGCTVDEAVAVVSTNDKQRFALHTDAATGIQWIRANQGHTLKSVKDSELLVEITDPKDAPVCVHGTYRKVLPLILQSGLSRMARNHIHFAPGLASENGGVISGMRGDCEVALYLNVPAALRAGIKLHRSENGVLLSAGDATGCIQPTLFEKVVDIETGKSLLPQAWAAVGGVGSVATRMSAGLTRSRLKQHHGTSTRPAGQLATEEAIDPIHIVEVVGDLFAGNYCVGDGICHCVSEDMHMGAGIAKHFKKRYGRVAEIVAQNAKVGGCAHIQTDDNCWVYYLVTKVKYKNKPTYASLHRSLIAMKTHMLMHNVKRLSLPKIGCGLDKLEWVIEGGKHGVRKMLADVFKGSGIKLTVYELESSQKLPAGPVRQMSEREAQMQKYNEHLVSLQAQGKAAEAHRSKGHRREPRQGNDRAGAGRAGRRVEQKMLRQESRDELLRCPEPAPAFVDGLGVEIQSPSGSSGEPKQCEQCGQIGPSGRLDTTVNQWFCDACWNTYEAGNDGTSVANPGKCVSTVSLKGENQTCKPDQLEAKRAAALRKLNDRSMGHQSSSDNRNPVEAWSNDTSVSTKAPTHDGEQMTAALLTEKWMTMKSNVQVLPFYTEHGQHGIFSNFFPSSFYFELPISLLFGREPPDRPRGFRSPVAVQWSEQAIMLCKAAMFRDFRSYTAIIAASSPIEAKRLGRAVRNFDEKRWSGLVCQVAKEVLSQKFAKVEGFAERLRATGTKVLAEASETDTIWGIGMRIDDTGCRTPSKWRGANVLGWSLMEVRNGLGVPSANETARQAAMTREDERLRSVSKSQVHVDKAPPKHSLAAMASLGSRRERQQDKVMSQMQDRAGAGKIATVGVTGELSYQEIHTCHLYGVDEVMSAFQKTMRRNQVDDAMWWAMELEMSGLGRMAMSRLTVIAVEDIGTGSPLLPVYVAAAWRSYMDLQDPQSTKFDALGAKAKLMEAAYTVSVVHGNHMTCSAKYVGRLALKAELLVVGDSVEAAANAADDGSKGLAERAGGLVASAKFAIEMARQATLPEDCTAMELKALGRLQALASRAPTSYSVMTWTMLRKFPTTFKCTHQSVEALFAMCNGGGCSTADLCIYNALLLVSREPWLSFPPSALHGIKVSDPMNVTPEACGCDPADGATASVDFESVAKMLSELPRGIGGRHANGLPWYVVDGHTRRGSGMDTTGLFHEAAQRWKLSSEVADWSAAEIAVSHGPGRQRGPVDENGHGGSWLRSPDGVSFPSNVERSFGHDDGTEDDPFGSAELVLESIWGVSGADMPDDAMVAALVSLGKARAPVAATLFLQDDSKDAFPSLEDAASGKANSVQSAGVGGNMRADSVSRPDRAYQSQGLSRRNAKGARKQTKRRSRVQGSGWADR